LYSFFYEFLLKSDISDFRISSQEEFRCPEVFHDSSGLFSMPLVETSEGSQKRWDQLDKNTVSGKVAISIAEVEFRILLKKSCPEKECAPEEG
jgi:hypothetical protein